MKILSVFSTSPGHVICFPHLHLLKTGRSVRAPLSVSFCLCGPPSRGWVGGVKRNELFWVVGGPSISMVRLRKTANGTNKQRVLMHGHQGWNFPHSLCHIDIIFCDLNKALSLICNIFHNPDDKAGCFAKLLSDVMEKNAPSKNRIFKKPSVPFMNSDLRKAMHKGPVLRNKYRMGLVGWEAYRRQQNLTAAIHKRSKLAYFWERCEGGVKNQTFGKTIKPFF